MGFRRSRSPRKCPRCSTNSTRAPPSSSTTWPPRAVRSSPRTSVRRLPDRRRRPGVRPPAGSRNLRRWAHSGLPTYVRHAGAGPRRQLRPAGAVGCSPESLRWARRQARGQIANVNCLTAGSSATRRGRQLLYFQYMSYCSRRRKAQLAGTFCGIVYHALVITRIRRKINAL